MGIFKTMKNAIKGSGVDKEDWNIITAKEEAEEVINASEDQPQLVYKHSHTCSICFLARQEIEQQFEDIKAKAGMNFLNVIKSRPVSNYIAEQTGVRHESPQALIIDKGEVVWHASHHSIKADAILEALKK